MTSINFVRSIVNRQDAPFELEPLAVAAGSVAAESVVMGRVAIARVAAGMVAAGPLVAVTVAVAMMALSPPAVTLMITHKRESSLTFMIKPAGFLMTKLA